MSEGFQSLLDGLSVFASREFVDVIGSILLYTPPLASLPTPIRLMIAQLKNYAIKGVYDDGEESKLKSLFTNDYADWLEKIRTEWGDSHPLHKTNVTAPFEQQKNTRTFKGFEPQRHVAMLGATTAGKTTTFIKMLMDDGIFVDFDQFVLVDTGLKQETTTNLFKAAQYNLRIMQKKPYNLKQTVYFKPHEMKDCINHISSVDKDMKKLVFLDDVSLFNKLKSNLLPRHLAVLVNKVICMAIFCRHYHVLRLW